MLMLLLYIKFKVQLVMSTTTVPSPNVHLHNVVPGVMSLCIGSPLFADCTTWLTFLINKTAVGVALVVGAVEQFSRLREIVLL